MIAKHFIGQMSDNTKYSHFTFNHYENDSENNQILFIRVHCIIPNSSEVYHIGCHSRSDSDFFNGNSNHSLR